MKIGVLALQGDVIEHARSLARLGAEPVEVRTPGDVAGLAGLVMPGGESTTIGKLLASSLLDDAVTRFAQQGGAVFGTCAGLILMARSINGSQQPRLGLLDVAVDRNAYGRQIQSFEADVGIPALGKQMFHAVFIRAPQVASVGAGVEVLAEFGGRPVVVRQGRCLAATFHPELTDDLRLHRYFLTMAAEGNSAGGAAGGSVGGEA